MHPAGIRIGGAARETGLSIDTIRFYQRSGLIASPPRTRAGYRIFGPQQLHDLHFIGKAQTLGFSLREIKELLLLRREPGHNCPQVRDLLHHKLAAVRQKVDALSRLERELEQELRKCKRALRARQNSAPHRDCCPVLAEIEGTDGHNTGR